MSVEALHKSADFESHHIEGRAHSGNTPFKCPLITQVKDELWQGGCNNGVSLGSFFKHVISLYPWERYRWDGRLDSFTEVSLYDSHDMPNLDQVIHLADWVNICRKTGRTLIHCQAGLNRSALVTALALIRGGDVATGQEAIDLLRAQRTPAVLCNETFERFVREYAKNA